MHTHSILFAALSDPTRLRIVEFLREGERPVGEIVEDSGIHQSGVSRHLGILHDIGVVRVRPDGQKRLYSLRPEPFREIDAWIAAGMPRPERGTRKRALTLPVVSTT